MIIVVTVVVIVVIVVVIVEVIVVIGIVVADPGWMMKERLDGVPQKNNNYKVKKILIIKNPLENTYTVPIYV